MRHAPPRTALLSSTSMCNCAHSAWWFGVFAMICVTSCTHVPVRTPALRLHWSIFAMPPALCQERGCRICQRRRAVRWWQCCMSIGAACVVNGQLRWFLDVLPLHVNSCSTLCCLPTARWRSLAGPDRCFVSLTVTSGVHARFLSQHTVRMLRVINSIFCCDLWACEYK